MSKRPIAFIFEGPVREAGKTLGDTLLRSSGEIVATEVTPSVVAFSKSQAAGPTELQVSILADLAPVRRPFERKSISSFRSAVRDLRKGRRP